MTETVNKDEKTIPEMQKTVERWSALTNLDMSGCVSVTDASLFSVVCFCTNLQDLNLSCCNNLTDSTVSELVKGCMFLKKLDISAEEDTLSEEIEKLTDRCLFDIALFGKNIEVLNLENRYDFTDQGIFEMK